MEWLPSVYFSLYSFASKFLELGWFPCHLISQCWSRLINKLFPRPSYTLLTYMCRFNFPIVLKSFVSQPCKKAAFLIPTAMTNNIWTLLKPYNAEAIMVLCFSEITEGSWVVFWASGLLPSCVRRHGVQAHLETTEWESLLHRRNNNNNWNYWKFKRLWVAQRYI